MRMARDPELHKQKLGALFGNFAFDEKNKTENNKVLDTANPWALQARNDVLKLASFYPDFETLLGEEVLRLFDGSDIEIVEDVCLLDAAVIRDSYFKNPTSFNFRLTNLYRCHLSVHLQISYRHRLRHISCAHPL